MTEYMTTSVAAERWGVEQRTVQSWIARGKLPGAIKPGHDWLIPVGTPKPSDRRYVENPIRNRRRTTQQTDTD
jgi:excisionase family DNA binding protein